MSYALQNILGHVPLTKVLRTNAKVPNPFPKELFTVGEGGRVRGDKAQYIRISTERRTAQVVKYGAPSKSRELRDLGEQSIKLLHIFENIRIDPNVLLQLRSFEQFTQDKGRDWLGYQIKEAGRRIGNAELVSVATTLRYGEIYIDGNGNVLPTSSGATETYSFQVPATHKNQINSIVSASWALANTDIPGQLRDLDNYAAQETGLAPAIALYGKNIPRYLMQNDHVQAHLVRNPTMNEDFLKSKQIPKGLLGYDWRYVGNAFIESETGGTKTALWDDDLITFLPNLDQPDDMDWWTMFNGSFMVPKRLEIARGGMDVFNNFAEESGEFAYGVITVDPPGAEIKFGTTFLGGLRNEKAIFILDSTP